MTAIENNYRPLMEDYPSLRLSLTVAELLMWASIAAWLYAAIVLYRREPGSLGRAKTALVLGVLPRIASGWSIPLLGGLPEAVSKIIIRRGLPGMLYALMFTGAWYLYLARSRKVKDLYGG